MSKKEKEKKKKALGATVASLFTISRCYCHTALWYSHLNAFLRIFERPWMIATFPTKLHKILKASLSIVNGLSICSTSVFFIFYRTRHHNFHGNLQQHELPLLLQACSSTQSPRSTKSLHALTITMGSSAHQRVFINNNLVTAYSAIGELSIAQQLFDKMPERNAVSYNSIIAAYNRHGDVKQAWRVFLQMMDEGLRPTQFTFGSILSSSSVSQGFQLLPLILKAGLLYADAVAGTALLGLFGRHGRLDNALKLFEEMPQKNVVTWNSIIGGLAQSGFVEEAMVLFRELLRTEIHLSEFSLMAIISAFSWVVDLESGEQLHGIVIKTGADYYPGVTNALVTMYAKCSSMPLAEKVFDEMPVKDLVSWNTMIAAYSKRERPEKALKLFLIMPMHGFLPNQTTFASVVSSCAGLEVPDYGKFIHAKTIKNNLEADVFVGSALVDFYAKCSELEDAQSMFDKIPERNIVSWNALISGYSMEGSRISIHLLREMLRTGIQPNEFTFSAVLKSSAVLELEQIHSLITRVGYNDNEYVTSSIISSYAINGLIPSALVFVTASVTPLAVVPSNVIAGIYNKTGRFQETQELLLQLREPDIVSWNILIAACARNEDYKEAFKLFKNMLTAQIPPDNFTFVSLLSVCSNICNLALGSSVHGLIIKINFRCFDTFVCNVLLDMYAKCGDLKSSLEVFEEMPETNLISWTALVSALGLHGYGNEALKRFKEMQMLGFELDSVAFLAGLSACRHSGLVEEGMGLFAQMKGIYGVEPDIDHYICVVDLLCKQGFLKEAERVISHMPLKPNALIWRIFLEGCGRNSNRMGFEQQRMSTT